MAKAGLIEHMLGDGVGHEGGGAAVTDQPHGCLDGLDDGMRIGRVRFSGMGRNGAGQRDDRQGLVENGFDFSRLDRGDRHIPTLGARDAAEMVRVGDDRERRE
jgi:hypothetical protein